MDVLFFSSNPTPDLTTGFSIYALVPGLSVHSPLCLGASKLTAEYMSSAY